MPTFCKYFARRIIYRADETSPIEPEGIYELFDVPPVCRARKNRHISSLKQWCPDAGGKGCRRYTPDPTEYEYSEIFRTYYRYLGPIGDPEAEAEARRIEEQQRT